MEELTYEQEDYSIVNHYGIQKSIKKVKYGIQYMIVYAVCL